MAKQTLPTNFVDDIFAPSMGGKRRYNLIQNSDGTYSLEDVTDYTQTGSDFGAGQINATNQAVNESCDKADVIDDLEDVVANQANGKIAGAKAVAELNGNNYEIGSDITSDHSIWYKKYNNGLIEYWGRSNSPSSSAGGQGFATINFPVPFKDMNYIVTATAEYASSSAITFETSVQRNSASRAYIYARTNTGSVTGAWIQWEAKGYWK